MPFQRRVARIGMWNGLSQTLLKLTCPGVPETYQGNEIWDFSLVDRDNRRPVDYAYRGKMFESIRRWGQQPSVADLRSLLEIREDGRVKLYLIWKTLCLGQQQEDLFREGAYVPLTIEGAKANHVFAFARNLRNTNALVIVPRLVAELLDDLDLPPLGPEIWADTRIVLPPGNPAEAYRNVLTGEDQSPHSVAGKTTIDAANMFSEFPVALLFAGLSDQPGNLQRSSRPKE